jgi:hypothetical protein
MLIRFVVHIPEVCWHSGAWWPPADSLGGSGFRRRLIAGWYQRRVQGPQAIQQTGRQNPARPYPSASRPAQ